MKFRPVSKTKINRSSQSFFLGSAFFVLVLFFVFTYSKTAHAGLISYLNSVLGSQEASAKIEHPVTNSQTIALLQASTNYDPNPEKSSGVAPILDDVLVAEIAQSDEEGSDALSTEISTYTVQSGDTLSEIAEMFGVSVNTIMWANDLSKGSSVRVGQTLIILPVTGINYTIKKGDTIKGIAQKYKADIDEILQYNDLAINSTLVAGNSIIIPDAEIQVSVPTKSAAKSISLDNPAHDTNGPSYPGYYARPIIGGVKTQGLHGYNAVDLAAPIGTPIYASAAGTVIASINNSGYNGGYGNYVIISHKNGTQTLYAHASKTLVTVGQHVEQGDKIALVGVTGKTTGPHVHFEIRGAKNPF